MKLYYAQILKGVVVNTLVVDEADVDVLENIPGLLVPYGDETQQQFVQIGYLHDGKQFSAPPEDPNALDKLKAEALAAVDAEAARLAKIADGTTRAALLAAQTVDEVKAILDVADDALTKEKVAAKVDDGAAVAAAVDPAIDPGLVDDGAVLVK